MDSLDDKIHQDKSLGAKKEFPKLITRRRYPRRKIELPTVCKMGAPNLALESCVGFISYPKLVKTPEMLIFLFLKKIRNILTATFLIVMFWIQIICLSWGRRMVTASVTLSAPHERRVQGRSPVANVSPQDAQSFTNSTSLVLELQIKDFISPVWVRRLKNNGYLLKVTC